MSARHRAFTRRHVQVRPSQNTGLEWPRARNDGSTSLWGWTGISTAPWSVATREVIKFLTEEKGLTQAKAFSLASIGSTSSPARWSTRARSVGLDSEEVLHQRMRRWASRRTLCARSGLWFGRRDLIRVAVVPFRTRARLRDRRAETIRADLAASGRFNRWRPPTCRRSLRACRTSARDWRRVDDDYLVVGVVGRVHDGGHEVEFRLVDVDTEKSMVLQLPSAPDALARPRSRSRR